MAIFTESTCLNWFNESENYGINFAGKYTRVDDYKNILKDKKIVCKCCGKEFVSPYADTQFCSDKCGYKYRRNYVLNYTAICKECGVEFKYGKGYSSEKDRQFCSLSCRTRYNNKHRNK